MVWMLQLIICLPCSCLTWIKQFPEAKSLLADPREVILQNEAGNLSEILSCSELFSRLDTWTIGHSVRLGLSQLYNEL